TLLMVQNVAVENIREQMLFQKAIDSRAKFAETFGGLGLRLSGKPFQRLSASFIFISSVGNRRRRFSRLVFDAFLLPLFQHRHKSIDAVQTARKAAVGI